MALLRIFIALVLFNSAFPFIIKRNATPRNRRSKIALEVKRDVYRFSVSFEPQHLEISDDCNPRATSARNRLGRLFFIVVDGGHFLGWGEDDKTLEIGRVHKDFDEPLVVQLDSKWNGAILGANVTLLDEDNIGGKITGIQTYRAGLGIEESNSKSFRLLPDSSSGGMPVDQMQGALEWRVQVQPKRIFLLKQVPRVDQTTFRFDFDMMDADEQDPSRIFRVIVSRPGAFCKWDGTTLVVSGPTGSDRIGISLFPKMNSVNSVPSPFRIICPQTEAGAVAGLQYAASAKASYGTNNGDELYILAQRDESRDISLENYYLCWNTAHAEDPDLRDSILEQARDVNP